MRMTPLINYSHLSLGRSLSTIEEIVHDAKEKGASLVGLTDWHTVAGAPRFMAACEKAGIKGIVGATVNVRVDDSSQGTLVFLAKDDGGYRNLMRVLDIAGEAGQGLGLPLDHAVNIERLFDGNTRFDGVVMLDGHKGSLSHALMGSSLHQNWFSTIAEQIPESQRYAVATPAGSHPAIERVPPSRRLITSVGMAPRRNHLPLCRSYFEDMYKDSLPDDEAKRLALVDSLYRNQSMDAPAPNIESALDMAAFASEVSPLSVYHPEVQVKGITSQKRPDFHASLDAGWAKLSARLRPEDRARYRDALEAERRDIVDTGLVPYFENVMYLHQWEASQGGYNMLRGSGVAALSMYVLGITQIDPLEYGLMFGRFINRDRNEEPDVDIEFSQYHSFYTRLDAHLPKQMAVINDAKGVKSSDALLNMVEKAFTKHSSLPDEGKAAYQKAITQLRRRVPTKRNNRAKSMSDWTQEIVALLNKGVSLSDQERHIISAAKVMVNGRRAYSVSNSTAIIVPEGVDTWFNIYRESKGAGEVNKVSLSKDDLAATGFVKHDFLSNRFFSRAANIANALNIDIYQEVDPDSPSISRVFNRGAYMGITQLSSTVGPRLADIMRPQNLNDLTALSALIRDGASAANIELAHHFARSRANPDPTLENSPLNDILGETYGLLLYEEQLLTLLMKKGGFSFSEADKLRSGLKKGSNHYIDAYRDRFIQEAARQARENGLSDTEALAEAEFCYAPIENKRDRFVFSKAHALAYMVLGVKLCDMKCYAPALFAAELYLDKTATHCFPEGNNGWQKSRKINLYDVLNEWEQLGVGKTRHNAQHLIVAIANAMTRENTAEYPDPDFKRDPTVVLQDLKEAINNGAMDFIMPDGFTRERLVELATHRMGKVPMQQRGQSTSREAKPAAGRKASSGGKPAAGRTGVTEAGGSIDQVKQSQEPINGRAKNIDFDTEILPGALFDFLQREGVIKGLQIEKKSGTQDSFRFRYTDRQGNERQRNFIGTGLRPDAVAKQQARWMTTVTEQGSRNAYPFVGLLAHLQNEIGFMGPQTVKMTQRKGLAKGEFVPLVKSFTQWLRRTENKLYPMDINAMTDYFEFDVTTSPVIPAVSRDDRRYAYNNMMTLLSESRAVSPELLNEWLDDKQILFVKTAMDSRPENMAKKITLDSPRKSRLNTNVLAVYRPVEPHRPLYEVPLVEGASLGNRGYQRFIKKMVDDPANPGQKIIRGNKIDFGKSTKRAPALYGGRVTKGADTLWVTEAIIDTYSFCDMQRIITDYNQRNSGDLPVSEENAVSIRSAGGGVRLLEQVLDIQGSVSETGKKNARGIPEYDVDFCQVQRRRSIEPLNDDKVKSGKAWLMERKFVWVGNPASDAEQKQFKRLRAMLHAFGLSAEEIKERIVSVPVRGETAQDRVKAYEYATREHFKTQREQLISSDNLDTWLRGNDIDVIESDNGMTVGVVKEELMRGPMFSTLPPEKREAVAATLRERFETMTGAKGIGVAVDPDRGGEQDAVFMRDVCQQIGLPVKSLRPTICEELPAPLKGYVKGDALKDHNDYLTLIRGLQKAGDVGLADDMIRYYAHAFEPPKPHQKMASPALPGSDSLAHSPTNDRRPK